MTNNKCTKNTSHATHLGISARLTAVALTKLGDVSRTSFEMIEGLRGLVDVGGDRPQDAHEISKLRVLSEDGK